MDPTEATDSPPRLPGGPGTYLLVLRLPEPHDFRVRSGAAFSLAPGTYVYVGSARGPGGLAGRLGRHLRGRKRLHWHLDFLLQAAPPPCGLVCFGPEIGECDLAHLVVSLPGALPVLGFGSSDCRCPAHLFRLEHYRDISGLTGGISAIAPDPTHLSEPLYQADLTPKGAAEFG